MNSITRSISRPAPWVGTDGHTKEPFLRRATASMCLFTLLLYILVPRFIQIPVLNIPLHFSVHFITLCMIMASSVARRGHATRGTGASIAVFALVLILIFTEIISTTLTTLPQIWEALIRDIVLVKCMFFIGRFMADFTYRRTTIIILETALIASFTVAIIEQPLDITFQSLIAKFAGAVSNAQVAHTTDIRIRDSGLRSTGFFEHPIVMSVAAGALVPWFIVSGLKKGTLRGYLFSAVVVAIICLAAYFSRSRTAILTIGVSVSVFVAMRSLKQFHQGKPTLLFIAISGAAISAPALLAYLSMKLTGANADEAGSTAMRVQMWDYAQSYLMDSPIIGWGMGNDLNISGIRRGDVVTIDDSYLSVLLNAGGLGLIIFVSLGLITVVGAVRTYLEQGDTIVGLNALAIACAVCAIYAGQFTNSIDHIIGILYALVGFWSIRSAQDSAKMSRLRHGIRAHRPVPASERRSPIRRRPIRPTRGI